KSSLLLLACALCLQGGHARAATAPQGEPSKVSQAKAQAGQKQPAKAGVKPGSVVDTFHTIINLKSLGATQALSLPGAASRVAVHFSLPSSEVVTSATLEVHYHLAPQLAEQMSRLNILVNGTAAASIPLLQSPDDHTDRETAITIPSDFLL